MRAAPKCRLHLTESGMLSSRGESLIELIVALVLLEIAGTLALAGALSVERAGHRADLGAAVDRQRWEQYRQAEVAPPCSAAPQPTVVTQTFPATSERPLLTIS